MFRFRKSYSGFTIVELLVVIVVIGILAAITIISYTGISQKANNVSLQTDLNNASKQLKMYYSEYGSYPSALVNNCTADTKYCLKPSSGNIFTYASFSPYSSFILDDINTNSNQKYRVTNMSAPASATQNDTVTIGTQTWMKYNLDVGTRIANGTTQSNNSVLEKWCYNNLESNCTIYGGLYQWDEMMQYSVVEGVQGICSAGFHLPTDNEYKTLEMYLGMTQQDADATYYRGTDQATQLKIGGTSGWDGLVGGYGVTWGWASIGSTGYYWTSSQIDASYAMPRYLILSNAKVYRGNNFNWTKIYGHSVRCLKD